MPLPKLVINSKQIARQDKQIPYLPGDDKVGLEDNAKQANLQKKSAKKDPVDLYVAAQKKVQAKQPSMVNIHFGQK